MRVTSKGQVTIPKAIRDQLGMQPGAQVDVHVDGDSVRIVRAATNECGEPLVDRLRGTGHGRMTTDEILALTRE